MLPESGPFSGRRRAGRASLTAVTVRRSPLCTPSARVINKAINNTHGRRGGTAAARRPTESALRTSVTVGGGHRSGGSGTEHGGASAPLRGDRYGVGGAVEALQQRRHLPFESSDPRVGRQQARVAVCLS